MATLSGTVQQGAAGLAGFDVNQVLSASQAQAFKDAGYDFCIRYIPRHDGSSSGNLTFDEATDILNAGLALMAVQHVANPGWAPTADLGTAYGSYAATWCSDTVGLPPGVNVWLDLEEVATDSAPDDVIAYCQAWYTAVKAAGYVPGIYIGYGVVLDGAQLYNDLSFQHYWRAYNDDTIVATRGFQIKQTTEKTLNGITFDPNTTQEDNLGGTPLWLAL
jgi:hypothetical protein